MPLGNFGGGGAGDGFPESANRSPAVSARHTPRPAQRARPPRQGGAGSVAVAQPISYRGILKTSLSKIFYSGTMYASDPYNGYKVHVRTVRGRNWLLINSGGKP